MSNLEVNITYETLFDFLRKEKGNEGIQKLPNNFYEDVMNYLKDKFAILEENKKKQDSFSLADHEKTSEDVLSIRKILKELYNRREKKIVKVALNTAMINAPIADTDSMLDYEIELFNKTVKLFKQFRSRVLMQLLNAKEPGHLSGLTDNGISSSFEDFKPTLISTNLSNNSIMSDSPTILSSEQDSAQDSSHSSSLDSTMHNSMDTTTSSTDNLFPSTSDSNLNKQKEISLEQNKLAQEVKSKTSSDVITSINESQDNLSNENLSKTEIEVLVLSDIPKFVGRELEIYGPYNKDESVLLPYEIFTILLSKGLVKEILN